MAEQRTRRRRRRSGGRDLRSGAQAGGARLDVVELDFEPAEPGDRDAILDALAALLNADLRLRSM